MKNEKIIMAIFHIASQVVEHCPRPFCSMAGLIVRMIQDNYIVPENMKREIASWAEPEPAAQE